MNKDINNRLIDQESQKIVIKLSWFILPILILQIIFHYTKSYNLENYQLIIIWFTTSFFILLNSCKKYKWVIQYYYIIQLIFLFILILLEFLWYSENPSKRQLFSFILGFTITGIVLIKTNRTILFYISLIIILIIINKLKNYEILRYVNYVFISGLCTVAFNIWRENLFTKIKISQNSYKFIFDDYKDLIFIINKDNLNIVEYNKSAEEHFKGLCVKGESFIDVFTCKNEKEDVLNYINLLNSENKSQNLETTCNKDNKGYVPKEFNFRKSIFFNQEVIVITIQLIKERKEKEYQLKESKKNITQILDNINSFVYNVSYMDNGDRSVKFASIRAEEILKIELDELVLMFKSNKTKDLIYPEDLSLVLNKVNEANKTLLPQIFEFRIIIDGDIRWVEEKIFPKREKDAFMHLGILRDITNQKRSELKLVASEQKYKRLYEESLVGIFKTNLDGKIIEANKAFANILGVERVQDLLERNINDFYANESDRKSYLNELFEQKALSNYILILKRADGKRLIVSNNIFYITSEDESFITGTLIDVTELHETAEALKRNELKLIETQESFKNIIDSSPAALFIFDDKNELVFSNLLAKKLSDNYLNKSTQKLNKIFDIKEAKIIEGLIQETKESIQSYTEISLEKEGVKMIFVLQVVKVKYYNVESNLILLRDITLEQEYNLQKLRAEQAEGLNINLEEEISRHKNTQQLLIKNIKFTENVLDSSLDMIIASDNNQIINVVNTATLSRLGYSKEEIIGQNFDILFSDRNESKVVFNAINNTEKFIGEIENIDKYGHTFKSFLSATTIKGDSGEVIGYMGVSRDLSEIEEIKKIIIDQSSLIESLFKNESNIFIWVINKDMNLVSFNESANSYFKIITDKELVKGTNLLAQINDCIKRTHSNKTKEIYQNALNGEKTQFEALMFDKKGKRYWMEIHLSPIILPNGEIEEVVCLGHDITDKKQKIKQIEENESNIRAVIKAIPDMIFKVSVSGEVLDYEINSEEEKLIVTYFLKNDKDLIGRNINEIFIEVPEFLSEIKGFIKRAIKTEKILTQNFDYKLNNVLINFENRFSKVNNKEAIIVVRNRTEEFENEQKLIDSIHEKEILLKEVHHRVKNNLQIINSILNLQSSYVTDKKTLEIINESQNRIRSMAYIHESLYQTNNFSSINFKDYIENLITNLTYSYQVGNKIKVVKNIKNIELALDQAIPCGLILNEIITNALKYAYPKNNKGDIIISIKEENNKVEIIIEDYGVGLPLNFDIETSESLGLSLVHTLVDQIDGELIVNSDGGTKFLIIFEKLES